MSIENAYNTWGNRYDTNVNLTRDLDKKCTIEHLENRIPRLIKYFELDFI